MNLQKTYLSRAMTRAMALDHPIGDPFGGPAYGERRDPVSAVVAVATMVASAGGAAALIGGAVTLGTVAAGLAFAGGAMSLVGNATGNKSLMRTGQIASLAGGIGGFFDSAGFLGEVAKDGTSLAANGTTMEQAASYDAALNGAGSNAAPSVSDSILGTANPDVVVNPAAAESIAQPTQLADTSTSSLVSDTSAAAAPGATPAPSVSSDIVNAGAGQVAGTDAGSMVGGPGSAQWGTDLGQEGLISSANPNLGGYQSVANPAAAGQQGAGWQYFSDPATSQGVAISPDGTYYGNGAGNTAMRQVTGAGGGEMSFTDKAVQGFKDLMPDTSNMSTMDKFLATKIGSEVVGGVVNYVAPSPQAKAQTQAAQAAAAANQAQADKIRADEELKQRRLAALKQNMSMGINMGTINPNAVTIASPTMRTGAGLINGARTA